MRAACSPTARLGVRCGPTGGARFTRPGLCRLIAIPRSASPGWSSRGRRWSGRRRGARGCACVQRRPALPRGAPGGTRGRAAAGRRPGRPAARAQAPKSVARWHMFPGVCARRAVRDGCTRHVTQRASRGSWSQRLRRCFCSTLALGSTRVPRPTRFWQPLASASPWSLCRRMRQTTLL